MKTARQLTLALLIAIACIVLIGGIMLLSDPSGRVFQLSPDDISGSLMTDFTPLAWLLIISVSGVGLVGAIFIFIRQKAFPAFIIAEGVILLLWCVVFIAFVSVSGITPLMFGIVGAALILLGRFIKMQQKDVAEHHEAFHESKDAHYSSAHPKSHHHKHRKHGH